MKISDILSMKPAEIRRMTRSELARRVSQLASAANKRLKRLAAAGLTNTPAYNYVERSGGKFSVAGKDIQELQNEYLRAKQFLSPETQTSTVRGARQAEKRVRQSTSAFMESINSDYNEWSEEDKKAFWNFFKGRSITHTIESYFGSYRGSEAIKLAQKVWSRSKSKNISTMRNSFRKAAERAYEASQEVYQTEFNETDDFLPLY